MAKQKATIHIAIINFIARDNLDIVCCLQKIKEKQKDIKTYEVL